MKLTPRQKHDIADRLALWLSAAMDQHAANDAMRKHIREWLDFQAESNTESIPVTVDSPEFRTALDLLCANAADAIACGNDFGTADKRSASEDLLIQHIDKWAKTRGAK